MDKYTDSQWLTAIEKAKIEKQWRLFLRYLADGKHLAHNATDGGSDYGHESPKVFTDTLYKHLSLHCGYIAHYNRHGFYSTYFGGDIADLEQFFKNFTEYKNSAVIWGDYADIGRVMCDIYEEYRDQIMQTASNETDQNFALLKELVKRSETDLDMRKKVISKFF